MLIYVFAELFPAVYKPYFDAQFAQFLDDGHELAIFAAGEMSGDVSRKVAKYGLRDRVSRYPTSLRTVAQQIPRLARNTLADPAAAIRLARRPNSEPFRVRLTDAARAIALPRRAPDLCLVHNLTTAVDLVMLRDRYPEVPIALYYHGGEVPKWSKPLPQHRIRRAFNMADVVFTNTEFSKSQVVARGCDPDKVVALPVGFDIAEFVVPEPRVYRPGGALRLVSAGRMSEEKGYRDAIAALQMLDAEERRLVEYTIIGDGYLRPEMEALVRQSGLVETVRFLGECTPEETIHHLGNADALLLPSIRRGNCEETQACVVQEALLMQTPVATSRTGGVPESIPDRMRSLSFDSADPVALRDVIRVILAMAPTELAELGSVGRDWVRQNYDIRTINRRLLAETLVRANTPR